MYEVFKIIQRFLGKFKFEEAIDHKEIFNKEYNIIMGHINASKTVRELYVSRAEIIEFNEAVKKISSPVWAKNKVKLLEARWNLRYRLWKLHERG